MDCADIVPFGITPAGETVYQISLCNSRISCTVITYGAILRTLLVPDRDGKPVDVVLGYDTFEQYLSEDGYLGATVGRVANRIAKGSFVLRMNTPQATKRGFRWERSLPSMVHLWICER